MLGSCPGQSHLTSTKQSVQVIFTNLYLCHISLCCSAPSAVYTLIMVFYRRGRRERRVGVIHLTTIIKVDKLLLLKKSPFNFQKSVFFILFGIELDAIAHLRSRMRELRTFGSAEDGGAQAPPSTLCLSYAEVFVALHQEKIIKNRLEVLKSDRLQGIGRGFVIIFVRGEFLL